jgi:plastocyanin
MEPFTTTPGGSWSRRAGAVSLAAVLLLGLAACGDDDDDTAGSDTEATTTEADAGGDTGGDTGGGAGDAVPYEVTEFSYQNLSVPAGATIEISNSTGAPHTFTSDEGSFEAEFGADGTATVTAPSDPGDYPFHCEIHPSMQATLTVEG